MIVADFFKGASVEQVKGWKTRFLFGIMVIVLAGCGSGSQTNGAGSQNPVLLSGTAATGLPIANTAVHVKDKNGNTVSETTSTDGSYSADVTNMTAPYLIKVGNLYSVATASGTANVHPFTDLIIRNWFKVQGYDVDVVFAGSGAMPSPPTAIEIATIESVVRQILAPYLSAANVDPTSFNLITTPFNADHSGFDLVLDNLIVSQPVAPGGDITIYDGGSAQNILTVPETISLTTAPTVTGFTPASGAVGATVTITGTNFSATPADNIVTFGGGINATVTAATTTSLTVTVPSGAANGAISVATSFGAVTSADTFMLPWSAARDMAAVRSFHAATLLPGGKVLVTGGQDSNYLPVSSAELYDPATNTWSAVGNMSTVRIGHTATLLPNGKVLIAGGWMGYNPIASSELYDPATNTWSPAASLASARFNHTATLLPSGKVLAAAGANAGGGGGLATAELYDPATDSWSPAGNLAGARQQHTATLLPTGNVLVTGGANGGGSFDTAELYDPAANTWSAAASMTTSRGWHTATLLSNGKVLAVGGYDANLGHLASTELYDPTTNKWSAASSMAVTRFNHTATLLPNGKVLVIAGRGNGGASVELYDPSADTWSIEVSMAAARIWHTATLLSSNRVLVAGGADSGGTPSLASAEISWCW